MRIICSSCPICFALLFFLASAAHGDELCLTQHYLTGDWDENLTKLYEKGGHIGFTYTAEPADSVSGSFEQESTYLHNINAELKLDLANLISIPKTQFLAKYLSRSGNYLSKDHVVPSVTDDGRYVYGEYYIKSQEAFGGQTTTLINFQFTTQFSQDLSIDYGRLVVNDLSLRSNLYCSEKSLEYQWLAAFGSMAFNTDDEISVLPTSFTAGCIYTGLIPTRDREKLGLMFTSAEHSEFKSYTQFCEWERKGRETQV